MHLSNNIQRGNLASALLWWVASCPWDHLVFPQDEERWTKWTSIHDITVECVSDLIVSVLFLSVRDWGVWT